MPEHRFGRALTLALLVLLAALLISSVVGAAGIDPLSVSVTLINELPGVHLPHALDPLDRTLLLEIRLPRLILAGLVGGVLAVAGAGYQGVFRNPLVDSGLLGASAGAGLGATLVIVGTGSSDGAVVPVAAFVGALLGVGFAYLAGAGRRDVSTLLLAGIAVSMFLSAVQTFVLQRSTQNLQAVYSWLLGSVSGATWHRVLIMLPYAVVGCLGVFLHGRHLDLLAVGDEEATSLGMPAARVRLLVIAASALAAASAVAVSGLIGFVGVVIPHVARRLAGSSYRRVLPLSLVLGAAFLMLVDTVARTIVSPGELPIGVVTALIGAPAFVWVLRALRGSAT
ncbi:iron ABC transporter permease [Calidifontibacter sp. DB0510]|uniref:Iron ABC transporter permease n=1 Tax=Metallococcus carri TaxID=1656884 RepID=A0A967AXG7_9MICO|nr:iron ABC transporter permease [Metallococcus carri]NOP36928.1 iron ABC transporter permease [Calidifontibacter sp. DB2511S]